jgi:hypothetical protein
VAAISHYEFSPHSKVFHNRGSVVAGSDKAAAVEVKLGVLDNDSRRLREAPRELLLASISSNGGRR